MLAAFALIILGGVVRVTESGLGCPDWPLCHGRIIPPLEMTAIIEYSHRLVASALLGPLIVATCAAAWISYRRHSWLVVPATVGLVLMLAQALLGGAAVLTELPGWIVATHLALGEALLALETSKALPPFPMDFMTPAARLISQYWRWFQDWESIWSSSPGQSLPAPAPPGLAQTGRYVSFSYSQEVAFR